MSLPQKMFLTSAISSWRIKISGPGVEQRKYLVASPSSRRNMCLSSRTNRSWPSSGLQERWEDRVHGQSLQCTYFGAVASGEAAMVRPAGEVSRSTAGSSLQLPAPFLSGMCAVRLRTSLANYFGYCERAGRHLSANEASRIHEVGYRFCNRYIAIAREGLRPGRRSVDWRDGQAKLGPLHGESENPRSLAS